MVEESCMGKVSSGGRVGERAVAPPLTELPQEFGCTIITFGSKISIIIRYPGIRSQWRIQDISPPLEFLAPCRWIYSLNFPSCYYNT